MISQCQWIRVEFLTQGLCVINHNTVKNSGFSIICSFIHLYDHVKPQYICLLFHIGMKHFLFLCLFFYVTMLSIPHYIALNDTVMCIAVAKKRLGKQTSTTERLFSMESAPWPLLCNGSVNMFNNRGAVISEWSVLTLYKKPWKLFRGFSSGRVVQGSSIVEDFMFAFMKCYSYSKIVLPLNVVTTCGFSINPITNRNPRLSHSNTWQYDWCATNWRGHGRNLPWNNFRYYAGISLKGLRKSIRTLTQDS
jgi:hypothetical protein